MRAHRHSNLGRLLQPRHYPRAGATASSGVRWAADNDAYGDSDQDAERRFVRMVEALSSLPGCLFVVCSDVVGEAGLTSLLSEEYAPLLWRHGLPPAYVLQEPGVEYDHAWSPWGSLGALFHRRRHDRVQTRPRSRTARRLSPRPQHLGSHGPRQQPPPTHLRRSMVGIELAPRPATDRAGDQVALAAGGAARSSARWGT